MAEDVQPPDRDDRSSSWTFEARLLIRLGEMLLRIDDALEIHRPCHTRDTEPWHCEHGHADEACTTGIPDLPAECVACTYDDRTVIYPCPTARALGIEETP